MQDAAQFWRSLISRKRWKVSGDCRNVPESADQRNWEIETDECLGDSGRTAPNRWKRNWEIETDECSPEIRKNRTQPMALIREEFQQASGSIVSMNTIRKEAHLHGFHGRCCPCP
ncbi:hypothetical protein CEXT_674851 [Caerostris extrusa]|uniref:Uncharacterized protein n=1 Tax=Caerostris extrusa TaxID=172846 RepID=A0AAV4RXI3_CAEEX|nr:hypothetical protein CEXT_674851 [Caerostris extrusa]